MPLLSRVSASTATPQPAAKFWWQAATPSPAASPSGGGGRSSRVVPGERGSHRSQAATQVPKPGRDGICLHPGGGLRVCALHLF